MAAPVWQVSDELWAVIEPLVPQRERRYRYPGRKRLSDRAALEGILFVLVTGIPWTHLPQQLGFGSGVTCWRRLEEWTEAGIEATLRLGLTNARIEAVNTTLRLIVRRAYGFHSAEALIALAMLTVGGLRPDLPGRA